MKLELFAPTERYLGGLTLYQSGQLRWTKTAMENRSESQVPSPSKWIRIPKKIIDFWIKSPNIIINVDVWGFLLGVDLFFRAAYHMSSRSRSELKKGRGRSRSSPGAPSRENEMSHLKWYHELVTPGKAPSLKLAAFLKL